MPEMDGYMVLEVIRREDLPAMVIVVSGDVQPEAHRRVMKLGALDFIEKPVKKEQLEEILNRYGISSKSESTGHAAVERLNDDVPGDIEIASLDCYQEVANIAMGRAADLLARLLGIFVEMPVPNVRMATRETLIQTFDQSYDSSSVGIICQGFIGAGIAGEALLSFDDSSFEDIAELLHYHGNIDSAIESELLMDIASILIGACLKGIAEQLDMGFSQGQPLVLGPRVNIGELLKNNPLSWASVLVIEMGCRIEDRNINCNLMLLFTEDSISSLNSYISFLAD
jgi:chemotaxis protein CheY-P-specific phosphatase CheC